jgi:hypothetical protein
MRVKALKQYFAYKYGSDRDWLNFDRTDYCVCQEIGMELIQKINNQIQRKKMRK